MPLQDVKNALAQLREANFATAEQKDRVVALQTELEGSQQQVQLVQQSNGELREELSVQGKQQQHLLDELSQSQVGPALHAYAINVLLSSTTLHLACKSLYCGCLTSSGVIFLTRQYSN